MLCIQRLYRIIARYPITSLFVVVLVLVCLLLQNIYKLSGWYLMPNELVEVFNITKGAANSIQNHQIYKVVTIKPWKYAIFSHERSITWKSHFNFKKKTWKRSTKMRRSLIAILTTKRFRFCCSGWCFVLFFFGVRNVSFEINCFVVMSYIYWQSIVENQDLYISAKPKRAAGFILWSQLQSDCKVWIKKVMS